MPYCDRQSMSGKMLSELDLDDMHYNIKTSYVKGEKSKAPRAGAVDVAALKQEGSRLASEHAAALLGMRDSLLASVEEDISTNKVARFLDRDLRILMCADSNQAVDNMLKHLHGDRAFIEQGYTIVRLGGIGQIEDPQLAHYCLDEQSKSHELYAMYELLWDAVLDRRLSYAELRQATREYVTRLREVQGSLRAEAEEATTLESTRTKLCDLADNRIESLIGRVENLVELFVTSKSRSDERREHLKSLKTLLRTDLKPLAKFVLLIRAQVGAPTHCLSSSDGVVPVPVHQRSSCH